LVNSEITDRDVSALPGSFVSGYRTRKVPGWPAPRRPAISGPRSGTGGSSTGTGGGSVGGVSGISSSRSRSRSGSGSSSGVSWGSATELRKRPYAEGRAADWTTRRVPARRPERPSARCWEFPGRISASFVWNQPDATSV